ncbi:acyl carrier protein [Streptomyces sp. NPDC058045]|uniref:acyl carrier protein n=1 Tax=Streptomyces sp. NPDC058045 TaxID=3346311 RepID=UPI0036F11AB5
MSSTTAMQAQLIAVMTEHFGLGPEEVTPAMTFAELDLGSLELAETAVVLEERFGRELPDIESELTPALTVAEAAVLLDERTADEHTAPATE